MVIVLVMAIVRAKRKKESELEALLKALVTSTRQEPGCLLYALHRVQGDDQTFVFTEKWQSEQALRRHMYSMHIRKVLGRQKELVETFQMIRLSPIDAAGL